MKCYMIFPNDGTWNKECILMCGGIEHAYDPFLNEMKRDGTYVMVDWEDDE